jgi:uncharacterized membrane protein YjgN (DUF898 family)
MTDITYEIYYQDGLKAGVDENQAIQQLAALLKMPEEKAAKIISATNRVVKAGLTQQQAEKYVHALDKIGMQVKMQAEEQDELALVDIEPEQVEQAEPQAEPQQAHIEPVIRPQRSIKQVAVEFRGQGMEYFKIWIVNIFLTILTLGIYSAWAKVRNKQYFYGNTLIDGSSFQYTASPIAILKGRIIAVVAFIIYSLVVQFVPVLGLLFILAFLAIIPWLVVRSLAFNARNSVYRNIRFNFTGKAKDAFIVFVLWPLLTPFTLGLIIPLVWYKQTNFIVSNSSYGTTGFEFKATAGNYYRIFFIALGALLGLGILISIFNLILGPMIMFVTVPVIAVAYLGFIAYIVTELANLHFNSTHLAKHGFTSTLELKPMAWIMFTNALAIVFSLGLMIPWAMVRSARYRAECLTLQVDGSLDHFVAAEQVNVSALGEEMGDVFDVEVSFI